TALRTVPWLTWNRAARSISLGISSPGFHSPRSRLCTSSSLIWRYSGLKAAPSPAGRAARVREEESGLGSAMEVVLEACSSGGYALSGKHTILAQRLQTCPTSYVLYKI